MADLELSFVKSNKGKDLLVHGGFQYKQNVKRGSVVYWKCAESTPCPGRAKTDGETLTVTQEHTHEPNIVRIESRQLKNALKERALVSQDSPTELFADGTAKEPDVVTAQLVKERVAEQMRYARRVRGTHSRVEDSLEELVFSTKDTETINGEKFLLFDSGPGEERTLMFATQENLQFLATHRNWIADGTFKVVPSQFHQLYTIHAVVGSSSYACVFILMSKRTKKAYKTAFEVLKAELGEMVRPETIMTDYEQAAIGAFEAVFPGAVQNGCFFHYSQALYRKLQTLPDLCEQYSKDRNVLHHLKMFNALAFSDRVEQAFTDMKELPFFRSDDEQLLEYIEYFERTWIGAVRKPKYAPEKWNCREAVLKGLPKTSNNVEGWHNAFAHLVGASHPNIWKFLEKLRKQQRLTEQSFQELKQGRVPARRKADNNRTILLQRIVQQQEAHPADNIEYLKALSNHLIGA
ncbi:hypothetical protein DMENIID0001_129480 [Sergentomyia squamirostris]